MSDNLSLDLLVVDDNADFAKFIGTVAEIIGLRAEAITDPSVFKDRFEAVRPRIVALDINLPGISGMQLAQWLGESTRATRSRLALIIISGEGEEALRLCQAVAQITGLDYVVPLSKPVEYAVLTGVLKDAAASVADPK